MKLTLSFIFSLVAASHLLAQDAAQTQPAAVAPSAAGETTPDIYPRWSIVGDWRVTHPDWSGVLTIRADGTLSNTIHATGRWLLASDAGRLLLVIRWDSFGTESLEMVTSDHFRGQKKKGRFIDMRRGDDASNQKTEAK